LLCSNDCRLRIGTRTRSPDRVLRRGEGLVSNVIGLLELGYNGGLRADDRRGTAGREVLVRDRSGEGYGVGALYVIDGLRGGCRRGGASSEEERRTAAMIFMRSVRCERPTPRRVRG
jgi:hypothetical protein